MRKPQVYYPPPDGTFTQCTAWMKVSGISEKLGIPRRTVYNWIANGWINKKYIGELANGTTLLCLDAFLVQRKGNHARLVARARRGKGAHRGRHERAPRDISGTDKDVSPDTD